MKAKTTWTFAVAVIAGAATTIANTHGENEQATVSNRPANAVMITSAFIAQLMEEAQTNNPALRAASFRNKAAVANVESVRVWDDPMFMFGGSVFSTRGMNPAMMGNLTYGISEKLPLWGVRGLNRQMARADLSVSRAAASFQYQQIRRDMTKALITAALAERVVEIDKEDLLWLKATSQAVDAKYRSGQADAGDSLEIQNEVAINADQLQSDQLELKHDQFVLNRLLNRDVDSPWPPLELPPVAPPVPFNGRLLGLAMANEPQLKVMDRQIDQAKAAAELTHRSRLPDISLGVQGNQYSGDGGFRSGMFTLSFPLSWGNREKYRKDYERARANEKAVEEDFSDQMLTTHEEVHHLIIMLDDARRQALLYQNEISARAEEALNDKLAGWEAGRVTLQDVVDARHETLNAQLMAARAVADQYQTLADLVLWTGQDNFESLVSPASQPTGNSTEK